MALVNDHGAHNISKNGGSGVRLSEPFQVKANATDLRHKVNAKAKGVITSSTRQNRDDENFALIRKRHSYTEVNGQFRCNGCNRLFKREGQLDRHKCFKEDFSPDTAEVKDAKRKRPDLPRATAPPKNAPFIQKAKSEVPYKKVGNTKLENLEEGPFFYRVKKNIQLCNPDVENGSKKVEVQVSVEGDTEEVIREMYQCLNCEAILPNLEDISRHLKGHMPTYQFCCKFCPDRWRFTHDTLSGVLKHVRSTHSSQYDSLTCVRCGFEASSATDLEKHMDLKHYPGTTYSCSSCGDNFGLSILSLVNHVRAKHATEDPLLLETVVIEAKTLYQSEDIYECNICSKIFFLKTHIEAHKEAHASGSLDINDDDCVGLFRCCHCSYQANHVEELRLHFNLAHQHLMCKICGAIIISGPTFTETLLNHVLVSHETKNDFDALSYFEQLFKEAKNLFSVKSSLKCKICPKMFFTRKSFSEHMRTHEGGNVVNFICEVCGFTCPTRQKLRRHVRSHKFLYYCPDSKLFFTSNQTLQEHLINCYSDNEELPCHEYKRSLVVSLFLPEPGFPAHIPQNFVNNDIIIDFYKGKTTNLCGEKFEFPKYAQTSLNKAQSKNNEGTEETNHELDEGYNSPMEVIETEKNEAEKCDHNSQENNMENAETSVTEQGASEAVGEGTTILLVTGEEGSEEQIAIELPPGTDGAQTLRELGLNVDNLNLPEDLGSNGASSNYRNKLELCIDSPYMNCENTEFCLALASQKYCWMTEETLQALMNSFGDMECLYCGKFYHNASRFYAHQNLHTKATQYKCVDCDYFSHSIQLLRYHQDRTHGIENLRCNECEYVTTSRVRLAQHLKKHLPKMEKKCQKCPFTCEVDRRMREHFTVYHPESTAEEIALAIGGKRSANMVPNLKIEPCKMCGKVFESSLLQEHLKSHQNESVLKCSQPQCEFTCSNEAYMTSHEQQHEKAKAEALKAAQNVHMFSCPLCNSHLKSEKALTSHIVNAHFESDVCPQCGHESANRGDFHCHLLIHSEAKSYACNICPTVLLQEAKMEEHFRTKHPGLRMHYTSFINENPIPIIDIVQLQHQPVSEMQPATADGRPAENSGSAESMQDMQKETESMPPEVPAGDSGTHMDDGHHASGGHLIITEEQINAALQALVEAGENVPEGAEIMVEDNTLFVNGVAKVIIAPADEEMPLPKEQLETMETAHNIGATDMRMSNAEMTSTAETAVDERHSAVLEMETSAMMSQSVVEETDFAQSVVTDDQIPQVTEKMDSTMAKESNTDPASDILGSSSKHAEVPSVQTETDFLTTGDVKQQPEDNMMQVQDMAAAPGADYTSEEAVLDPQAQGAVAEEEYINLDNLDFSNLNLPPGNYNLVIDEQGQAVFVPTDVIDENTIQVVAQE